MKMQSNFYFQSFICPQFHAIQMNLQTLQTPLVNVHPFQLIPLNYKIIYNKP
jgi:hypothetical protein